MGGGRHGGVHGGARVRVQAVLVNQTALLARVPPDAAAVDIHGVITAVIDRATGRIAGAL